MSQRRLAVFWSLAVLAPILVASAGACSSNEPEVREEEVGRQSQALEAGGDAESGACRSVVLVASKTYGPSQWADATEAPAPELRFALPSHVPVSAGNAGNHWITFTFSRGAAAVVSCRYKGARHKRTRTARRRSPSGRSTCFLPAPTGRWQAAR